MMLRVGILWLCPNFSTFKSEIYPSFKWHADITYTWWFYGYFLICRHIPLDLTLFTYCEITLRIKTFWGPTSLFSSITWFCFNMFKFHTKRTSLTPTFELFNQLGSVSVKYMNIWLSYLTKSENVVMLQTNTASFWWEDK